VGVDLRKESIDLAIADKDNGLEVELNVPDVEAVVM